MMIDAALAYARAGLRVLPVHTVRAGLCSCPDGTNCKYTGKHPRTRHGVTDATTKESTIRRWWRQWPDANVAVATGAESGLYALDIDPRHGGSESLAGLISELGPLPATTETITGGGGRHLFFSHPGGHVANLQGVRNGIDTRGDGGYVVAPPSIHKSGAAYLAVDGRALGQFPPAELPAAWREWLAKCGAIRPCNREYGEPGEHRVHRGTPRNTEAICASGFVSTNHEAISSPAIDAAIRLSLPKAPGQRNRQVFELARALRAIPALAEADPLHLEPIVRRWHALALPHISTEPFDITWAEFLYTWPRVKFPLGEEPMSLILEKAKAADDPPFAAKFESPGLRLLVRLCRELQQSADDGPFYLSCRKAGKLLEVDHVTAHRWLFLLERTGVLLVVQRGSQQSRKATRYRYMAAE